MEMDRRSFLKKVIAGGALRMAAGPLMISCSGIRRSDLQPAAPPLEGGAGFDSQRMAILYYASLAPSGHNSQPWYVKVAQPGEWIIGADPQRRLVVVDPQNRELFLAIGAFTENLSIAAASVGYDTEVKVVASSPDDREILMVRCQVP